jgi:hypothetical protein
MRDPGFKAEKESLANQHQIVRDREMAKKVQALEDLKSADRQPITIPSLNERDNILNSKPRVKPIIPTTQLQPNLNINK